MIKTRWKTSDKPPGLYYNNANVGEQPCRHHLMNEKSLNQLASRLGYGLLSKKSGEVVTDTESATSSNKPTKLAPRNYLHTPEQIAKELRIDEEGNLWWIRKGNSNRRSINKPAGYLRLDGYIEIKFGHSKYLAHVIAFALWHKRWPNSGMVLDHIDRNVSNNRKENIREVSNAENMRNPKGLKSNNKSGINGVYWNSQINKWYAYLKFDGKTINGGFYEDIKSAIAARKRLEIDYDVFEYSILNRQSTGGN